MSLIPEGTRLRLVMPDHDAPPPPAPPPKPGKVVVYDPHMRVYFYWDKGPNGMPVQPKSECLLCKAGVPRTRMT